MTISLRYHRRMIRWLLLPTFAGLCLAQDPMAPHSAIAPPAAKAAKSPELRRQFEARLEADPQFAADGRARLQWWFQPSRYDAGDTGRYPIVRVWEKNW